MLLIIIWYFFLNYFWPRPWPQPPEIGFGLIALASASRFWPRLTSVPVSDKTCSSVNDQFLRLRLLLGVIPLEFHNAD